MCYADVKSYAALNNNARFISDCTPLLEVERASKCWKNRQLPSRLEETTSCSMILGLNCNSVGWQVSMRMTWVFFSKVRRRLRSWCTSRASSFKIIYSQVEEKGRVWYVAFVEGCTTTRHLRHWWRPGNYHFRLSWYRGLLFFDEHLFSGPSMCLMFLTYPKH